LSIGKPATLVNVCADGDSLLSPQSKLASESSSTTNDIHPNLRGITWISIPIVFAHHYGCLETDISLTEGVDGGDHGGISAQAQGTRLNQRWS